MGSGGCDKPITSEEEKHYLLQEYYRAASRLVDLASDLDKPLPLIVGMPYWYDFNNSLRGFLREVDGNGGCVIEAGKTRILVKSSDLKWSKVVITDRA